MDTAVARETENTLLVKCETNDQVAISVIPTEEREKVLYFGSVLVSSKIPRLRPELCRSACQAM